MRRKGLWLILLIAVMMASVCWFWWTARAHDRANSRTLADGSVVKIKKVTCDEFRVRTGNRWRDYVGMMLPERWASVFGARSASIAASTNSLTVWIQWQGGLASGPLLRVASFDEHGCELGLTDGSPLLGNGEDIVVQLFEFPRRER